MFRRFIEALICMMLMIPLVLGQTLLVFAESEEPKAARNSGINWICPYCSAELRNQEGFSNEITEWVCTSCGNGIVFPTKDMEGFDPVESFKGARFPGIYWYCDGCGSFLNRQEGFDDHLDRWECTVCGHVNPIADDAIIDEEPAAAAETTDDSDQKDNGEPSENEGDASSDKTLLFGHYEQDGNLLNGPEPIEWIILDQTESSSLLISKDPLDYKAYNEKGEGITWADCSLRAWLNVEFLDTAFYPTEQAAIAMTEVDNSAAQTEGSKWETNGGRNTQDRVFLLSYKEYESYIKDDSITVPSYLRERGAKILFLEDSSWWLRSPGKKQDTACYAGFGKAESGLVSLGRCIRPVIWLVDTAYDWETDYANRSIDAYELAEQGKYAEAVAITDLLGNYWGSKLDSVSYRVNAGDMEFEAENYAEAVSWYSAAQEFANENFEAKDASKLIQDAELSSKLLEARYQLAVSKNASGDFDGALEIIKEIGQYKDSMDLLVDCLSQKHINFNWLTDDTSAVNTGYNNGYAKTNPITKNDPHFGWCLGRFMISGYTERSDDSGMPEFLKAPGDTPTLWFVLEQDIDALNGDKSLFIARDRKGTDQQLGVEPLDFGKGVLIIRSTDDKTKTTRRKEYPRYLEAASDTGANTRFIPLEEGTYQVALDYRVGKKSKIAFVDKWDYSDYRIYFTFKIKNAGSMFFLFDLGSGSELDDYSTTVDGFRIDLANSQSLRVDYTRYAINQSGTALDPRKDTVAADYIELNKTGYYEITATNKETGIPLTKHVFVGRAADLEEFKEVDPEKMAKFG